MNQDMDIDQIFTPPTPPPSRIATPNAPQRPSRIPRNLQVDVPERNNPRAHPIFNLLLDNNNQPQ